MNRSIAGSLVAALLILVPVALGEGAVNANPLVNGDFDAAGPLGLPPVLKQLTNTCVGVGHQVIIPLYSPWGDSVVAAVNDPEGTAAAFADDPAGQADAFSAYPVAHVGEYVAAPDTLVGCDPQHREFAAVNPWAMSQDMALAWSNDAGTRYFDLDGDGDTEAVIPTQRVEHSHTMWQSGATLAQAFSLDFDAFEWTLEAGAIPGGANNQIGFSLTPSYMQHPFVGVFWEGALLFRATDMQPDENGRVSMDPVRDGEIACPGGYPPCDAFRAEFVAAQAANDEAAARALLGQARIAQTSFWSFNNPAGLVAIDDVAFVGAKTMAETAPRVNPPV